MLRKLTWDKLVKRRHSGSGQVDPRFDPGVGLVARARALTGRFEHTLAHTSPVRLLLLICVTIGVSHSLMMSSLHTWHAVLPEWAHSLTESTLLVIVLFPVLYFFSFRPILAQNAERERAEATMWASEHKYRHLFNSLGDAAFLIEAGTGRIIDANLKAETLVERNRAEIVGAKQNLLFPDDKVSEIERQLKRRGEDEATGFEAEVQTAKVRRVPVHVSAAPLSLFGHDLIVALIRDITEFKTLHDELLRAQRLESVGAIAAGVAHDLNNALTPILFAAEILHDKPHGSSETHLLEAIGNSATRASQIVRQMLTFVRGGEGQRSCLQLRHLVREVTDMAGVAFPKSIQIHESLSRDLWMVQADPAQLSQVLMNLAVNARDAMPTGGELSFSGENLIVSETVPQTISGGIRPGSYVVLGVTDTGCGMSAELQTRIFDPFFTTKPVGQGTGLGLATARDIITDHGGSIQVTSRPGCGTTFRLFLPAVFDTPVTAIGLAETRPPRGNGELVLIADDETVILEMTRAVLESAGYRVLQAHDGTEAVAFGAERKGDLGLAVIDLEMPFLDGKATQRALHKINPSLKIIQMSGKVQAVTCSPDGNPATPVFLQKPFSAEQMLRAVHTALHP